MRKCLLILYWLDITLFMTSCFNEYNNNKILPIVTYKGDKIEVISLDTVSHNISIVLNNDTIYKSTYRDIWTNDLLYLLRKYNSKNYDVNDKITIISEEINNKDICKPNKYNKIKEKSYYELSLLATENLDKISLPIQIRIDDSVDTTLIVNVDTLKRLEPLSSITGKCANLVISSNTKNQLNSLKKWLYNNRINVSEKRLNKMYDVVNWLKYADYIEYITLEDVPIITNLENEKYKVKSIMDADYYILFAHYNDTDIDEFIGDIITNDFSLVSKSLKNPMTCHFIEVKNMNYLCISLLGINKDWSYQIEPLGLVFVDKAKPIINGISLLQYTDYCLIINKNNAVVRLPIEDNLLPYGNIKIETQDFVGNNAQFKISWEGDVKEVTVIREIKNNWIYLTKGRKTINLLDKESPYYFSYELDLSIGDNYVPIEVKDIAGNISIYNLHIKMVRQTDNSSDINVNNYNNIDLW